jgi:hypothetical protein
VGEAAEAASKKSDREALLTKIQHLEALVTEKNSAFTVLKATSEATKSAYDVLKTQSEFDSPSITMLKRSAILVLLGWLWAAAVNICYNWQCAFPIFILACFFVRPQTPKF